MSEIDNFMERQHIVEECDGKANHISVDLVTRLAKKAKIRLFDEEKQEYMQDLTGVINWLHKIECIEMRNLGAEDSDFKIIDKKANDENSGDGNDDVLNNVDTEYQCFVVPKIVENE